jgi:hypothetical protein
MFLHLRQAMDIEPISLLWCEVHIGPITEVPPGHRDIERKVLHCFNIAPLDASISVNLTFEFIEHAPAIFECKRLVATG